MNSFSNGLKRKQNSCSSPNHDGDGSIEFDIEFSKKFISITSDNDDSCVSIPICSPSSSTLQNLEANKIDRKEEDDESWASIPVCSLTLSKLEDVEFSEDRVLDEFIMNRAFQFPCVHPRQVHLKTWMGLD